MSVPKDTVSGSVGTVIGWMVVGVMFVDTQINMQYNLFCTTLMLTRTSKCNFPWVTLHHIYNFALCKDFVYLAGYSHVHMFIKIEVSQFGENIFLMLDSIKLISWPSFRRSCHPLGMFIKSCYRLYSLILPITDPASI